MRWSQGVVLHALALVEYEIHKAPHCDRHTHLQRLAAQRECSFHQGIRRFAFWIADG